MQSPTINACKFSNPYGLAVIQEMVLKIRVKSNNRYERKKDYTMSFLAPAKLFLFM